MDSPERFRRFYVATGGRVYRYARTQGLDEHAAQDLVAAVFETAWRRMDRVPEDDPLPWLLAVARNKLQNLRRAEARRWDLLRRLPAPPVVPDAADLAESTIAPVLAALGTLSPSDQEVLCLVAWHELSMRQIATVLGRSEAAVRTRLHRARNRLAAELSASGNDVQFGSAARRSPQSSEMFR